MAAGLQNQEEETGKSLRNQLAAITRSIQWSYAIFWSLSTRQPGMLEWNGGYYNGDIKTRKTTEPVELNADQWGRQRSEQLRELYLSLSAGDTNQQARRPSASLSPEDLTDLEWYYLVCMSFTFSHGQGLPGRTLSGGNHIWLCNAQYAESQTFSRSLLAKSASIQTVVCFPFMGGVIELGTTDLVLEDLNLTKKLSTSFWEFPKFVCTDQSISTAQKIEEDEVQRPINIDEDIMNTTCSENLPSKDTELIEDRDDETHASISEELKPGSPDYSSNDCCLYHHTDDSFMIEGGNGSSQVQSWQIMDDELCNNPHVSMKSSDCISQSFANPRRIISSSKGERLLLDDLQECNYGKLSSLDLGNDDLHYKKTLSAILRMPSRTVAVSYLKSGSRTSNFRAWSRGLDTSKVLTSTPQKMLKKVLLNCTQMHDVNPLMPSEANGLSNRLGKSEGEGIGLNHVERRRREKLSEKFFVLQSLVPSVRKVDKASILGDTIEYLKELERRVEELESCRELVDSEARNRKKHPDISERTSDNYGYGGVSNGRKPYVNKRKASDIYEAEDEHHLILSKDCLTDVRVTIIEKEVLIEMDCPWRECLLVELVDAISNLHLDAYSVHSSTEDGILSVTIKSKFLGTMLASPGMIKQALYRVVGKR